MKYKRIYNMKEFAPNTRVLFGNLFEIKGNYIFNNETCYIEYQMLINKPQYAEVDEQVLFEDILRYGNKLYKILKDDLCTIYNDEILEIRSLVKQSSIKYHSNELEKILLDFVNDYGIPIYLERYNNSDEPINSIAYSAIIEPILLIYMIHTIYSKLTVGYKEFKQAYECFSITEDFDNDEILEVIADICNSLSGTNFGIGIYRFILHPIVQDKRTYYYPCRYAENLFTFAWDVLLSLYCTFSFIKVIVDTKNTDETYRIFKRCPRCLSTISEKMDFDSLIRLKKDVTKNTEQKNEILFNKIPKLKKLYCSSCQEEAKKESKKNADNNYYNDLKKEYNNIKNRIDEIDISTLKGKELYNEIKSLEFETNKRKVSKRILKELNERIEEHKKNDKILN